LGAVDGAAYYDGSHTFALTRSKLERAALPILSALETAAD